MDVYTPPPTPPRLDSTLQLSPCPLSPTSSCPPLSPDSATSEDPRNSLGLVNMNGLSVVRSRCDSETTLLNNDQEVEEEKGQETVDKGGNELGGRETEMMIDLEKLREILLENARDSNVEGGERFFCLGKACHERESSKVAQLEEELKILRQRYKRAQQSIRDLRSNNFSLRLEASEAIAISHQAERDLSQVLLAFKLKRGQQDPSGRDGGRRWILVFALLVWVFFTKCC
ncbi:hypothetical protein JCM16303_004684 [Sporobolomyces ruberrimus]